MHNPRHDPFKHHNIQAKILDDGKLASYLYHHSHYQGPELQPYLREAMDRLFKYEKLKAKHRRLIWLAFFWLCLGWGWIIGDLLRWAGYFGSSMLYGFSPY